MFTDRALHKKARRGRSKHKRHIEAYASSIVSLAKYCHRFFARHAGTLSRGIVSALQLSDIHRHLGVGNRYKTEYCKSYRIFLVLADRLLKT